MTDYEKGHHDGYYDARGIIGPRYGDEAFTSRSQRTQYRYGYSDGWALANNDKRY